MRQYPPELIESSRKLLEKGTDFLIVTVSEPRVQETTSDGQSESFVTYRVCTSTNLPFFDKDLYSIERRFSEFKKLHTLLSDEEKIKALPPMPSQHIMRHCITSVSSRIMNLETQQFLESRCKELNDFLS
ncbi:MAG: Sorting nexin-30, partial [Marteilia pararefringens]